MYRKEDREADIVAVGGVQVPVMGAENEREITREEVKRALNEMKGGKAPGMDGVRVEMLKEGGATVLEWLVRVFNIYMLYVVNSTSGLDNSMHGAIIQR